MVTKIGSELRVIPRGVSSPMPGKFFCRQHMQRLSPIYLEKVLIIFDSIRSLHLHRAEIENPPLLPMPGEYFVTRGPSNYAYSHHRTYVPTQVGEVFKEICRLSLITHDIVWVYFGKNDVVPAAQATLDFAERTYQRLIDWATKLPLELARGKRNRHSTIMLQ